MPNKSKRQAPARHKCERPGCGQYSEWTFCYSCTRTCNRKVKYAREPDAFRAYRRIIEFPWDDPTLMIYRCELGDHWHLGHRPWPKPNARRMRAVAEKVRRRALLKSVGLV